MSKTTDNAYDRAAGPVYDVKGNLVAPPVVVRTPDATSYRAEYDLGDIVYLRVRDEPVKGMVTGIMIRQSGVVYFVCWANDHQESGHFAIELHDQPEL